MTTTTSSALDALKLVPASRYTLDAVRTSIELCADQGGRTVDWEEVLSDCSSLRDGGEAHKLATLASHVDYALECLDAHVPWEAYPAALARFAAALATGATPRASLLAAGATDAAQEYGTERP